MSRFVYRIKEYSQVQLSGQRGKKFLPEGACVDMVSKYWVPECAGFGDYNENYEIVVFCQFRLALIRKDWVHGA